ncbi:MAG: NAD(P)/FAD-dependent oxidoreductase [Planctomycetes bacterium]|nr:NAD(P)/FAD-dependent oxidoreductase [Planctomycetota bacterium]
MIHNEITIVGGGPAGIACAVQLARFGYSPVVYEKNLLGGLLLNANSVENYPGFPEGISGQELCVKIMIALNIQKIEIKTNEVKEITFNENLFEFQVENETISSDIIVIATGTKPKNFKEFEIPESVKERIFYEVYPLLKEENNKIIVVGGGDAAFDYSLNLSKQNQIKLLVRKEKTCCLPVLEKQANENANISLRKNSLLQNISFNNEKIIVESGADNNIHTDECDYLVFAIGRVPETGCFSSAIGSDVDDLIMKKKLFTVGDVQNGLFRQTAIAVGDGVRAAMEISKEIENKGKNENNKKF